MAYYWRYTVTFFWLALAALCPAGRAQSQVNTTPIYNQSAEQTTLTGEYLFSAATEENSGYDNAFIFITDGDRQRYIVYTNQNMPPRDKKLTLTGYTASLTGNTYPAFLAEKIVIPPGPVPPPVRVWTLVAIGLGVLAMAAILFFAWVALRSKSPQPITAQMTSPPGVTWPADAGKTVFIAPDSEDTVSASDETLSVLPACFEVIGGGEEEANTVKYLYSLRGNPEFGIGRIDDSKSIANYLPIRSTTVSRDSGRQGKLIYDPQSNQCTIINLADPNNPDVRQRKNPIKVNSAALSVAQQHRLIEGDTVQIGEVRLRFHETPV